MVGLNTNCFNCENVYNYTINAGPSSDSLSGPGGIVVLYNIIPLWVPTYFACIHMC